MCVVKSFKNFYDFLKISTHFTNPLRSQFRQLSFHASESHFVFSSPEYPKTIIATKRGRQNDLWIKKLRYVYTGSYGGPWIPDGPSIYWTYFEILIELKLECAEKVESLPTE